MTCGVYEFWCGPHFYQGSSKNIERRWKTHLNDLKAARHVNPKIQAAYDKYGWTDAGILVECEEHALLAWEQAYIDTNWGDAKYLNLSPTADRMTHTPESRAKIGAAQKGRTQSEESRAKISAAKKGKTHSDEARSNMSASQKGKTLSAETRAKIGAFHKGKIVSEETRAKLSEAGKGKTYSDERRAKMGAGRKERWDRDKAERMGDAPDIFDLFGGDE